MISGLLVRFAKHMLEDIARRISCHSRLKRRCAVTTTSAEETFFTVAVVAHSPHQLEFHTPPFLSESAELSGMKIFRIVKGSRSR